MSSKHGGATPFVTLTSIIFVVILLAEQCYTIRWLAMANDRSRGWNKTRHCSKYRRETGLYKGQVRLCQKHLEFMPIVAHATRQTADVCQTLFADRRWNCSSVKLAPNFMADLTGGSREQAFVYALASASLTQSIAKSCSLGVSTKCSCGRLPNTPPPGEFKWGGCGDDLRYGVLFSRWFADGVFLKRKKKSKKVLMSLHNNRAGRKAVETSLQTACKCHGVSGSCSIKTCWKALADMTTIGGVLLKRYAVAVEAKSRRMKKLGGEKKLVSVARKRLVADTDLVYCRKSPDYCLPDASRGSVGTHGRECKKGDPGSSGCQLMCCGRGITSRVVRVRHRCDCKYYWCCYVKCKTCIKDVVVHRCR